MTAIVAALPREIAGLVRGLKPDAALRVDGVWLYRMPHAVVVAAGMGERRVTLGVQAALAQGDVAMLVSVGLAGACTAQLRPGSVAEAGVVIDARTGERYATASADGAVLVSTQAIASVREKARLASTYGAAIVDMEAATVARLAAAHGVPFRAIKAVSDAHDFEIDSLGRFADERGQFRTAAFALHTALRPGIWGKTMELGGNSSRALTALTETLRALAG
jgi:adenosylhomocysteine nucleosidase